MKEFIFALVHSLRTPLSVIQSDLEYIQSAFPEAEALRSLRSVSKIAEVLSRIESISEAENIRDIASNLQLMSDWKIDLHSENTLRGQLIITRPINSNTCVSEVVTSLSTLYQSYALPCLPEAYALEKKLLELGFIHHINIETDPSLRIRITLRIEKL